MGKAVRCKKFVWSQRLFLFSTNSASDSFGSAADHGPKILRFVLPKIGEKMSTYSVQERWDALFDSDLRDFGLTAWKTWLACMRFSMYCPSTVFSDLSRRFSSLTWPTNQRWVLWLSTNHSSPCPPGEWGRPACSATPTPARSAAPSPPARPKIFWFNVTKIFLT